MEFGFGNSKKDFHPKMKNLRVKLDRLNKKEIKNIVENVSSCYTFNFSVQKCNKEDWFCVEKEGNLEPITSKGNTITIRLQKPRLNITRDYKNYMNCSVEIENEKIDLSANIVGNRSNNSNRNDLQEEQISPLLQATTKCHKLRSKKRRIDHSSITEKNKNDEFALIDSTAEINSCKAKKIRVETQRELSLSNESSDVTLPSEPNAKGNGSNDAAASENNYHLVLNNITARASSYESNQIHSKPQIEKSSVNTLDDGTLQNDLSHKNYEINHNFIFGNSGSDEVFSNEDKPETTNNLHSGKQLTNEASGKEEKMKHEDKQYNFRSRSRIQITTNKPKKEITDAVYPLSFEAQKKFLWAQCKLKADKTMIVENSIVFAKQKGYSAWPAKVIERKKSSVLVEYIGYNNLKGTVKIEEAVQLNDESSEAIGIYIHFILSTKCIREHQLFGRGVMEIRRTMNYI